MPKRDPQPVFLDLSTGPYFLPLCSLIQQTWCQVLQDLLMCLTTTLQDCNPTGANLPWHISANLGAKDIEGCRMQQYLSSHTCSHCFTLSWYPIWVSALQTLSQSLFQVMAAASRLCSSTLAQYNGESRAKSFASRTIRHGERRWAKKTVKPQGSAVSAVKWCQKSKCHTNVAKTAHCRLVLSSPSIFEVWLLQGYLHVLLTKSRSSCCDKGCHSIHASTG